MVALRLEVDRAVPDGLLRVGGARVDADAAARAVVGGDLDRHLHPRQVPVAPVLGGEAFRGAVERLGREHLHPDRGMRADDRALGAVDADGRIPDRDLLGDRALLEAGGADRERAVDREGADGEGVAAAGEHRRRRAGDEVGRLGDGGSDRRGRRDGGRHRDLAEPVECGVDRGLVAVEHRLAALAVGAPDRLLDREDRLVERAARPRGRRSTSAAPC